MQFYSNGFYLTHQGWAWELILLDIPTCSVEKGVQVIQVVSPPEVLGLLLTEKDVSMVHAIYCSMKVPMGQRDEPAEVVLGESLSQFQHRFGEPVRPFPISNYLFATCSKPKCLYNLTPKFHLGVNWRFLLPSERTTNMSS